MLFCVILLYVSIAMLHFVDNICVLSRSPEEEGVSYSGTGVGRLGIQLLERVSSICIYIYWCLCGLFHYSLPLP